MKKNSGPNASLTPADADWHDPSGEIRNLKSEIRIIEDLSGHLTDTPDQVLWARGAHDINDMPNIGPPASELLEAAK